MTKSATMKATKESIHREESPGTTSTDDAGGVQVRRQEDRAGEERRRRWKEVRPNMAAILCIPVVDGEASRRGPEGDFQCQSSLGMRLYGAYFVFLVRSRSAAETRPSRDLFEDTGPRLDSARLRSNSARTILAVFSPLRSVPLSPSFHSPSVPLSFSPPLFAAILPLQGAT